MSELYGYHLKLSGQTVRVVYHKTSEGEVEFKAVHELVVAPQSGSMTWFDGSPALHDRLRQQVHNSETLRERMWGYGRLLSELSR